MVLQVKPSKIRQDHVVGKSLLREIGSLSGNAADTQGRIWTHLLNSNWVAHCHEGETWNYVRKNAWNDSMIIIRHSKNASRGSKRSRLEYYCKYFDGDGSRWFIYNLKFGLVSSTAILQNRACIFTFSRSEPNMMYEMATKLPSGTSEDYRPPGPYGIDKFTTEYDYWSAALHPDISKPKVAIGTQSGVLIHNPLRADGRGMTKYTNHSSPTLSIEWKSENVIAAGQDDSTMHLYDIRARDTCFRLQHGTAITRLRCVDDSRILLGGPNHLDMYDLRYTKTPHRATGTASRPWFHYHDYNNTRSESRDFDISPRLGLLAVAQDATTEVWNLWTGVRYIQLLSLGFERGEIQKNKVVSFMRSSDHPQFAFAGEDVPEGIFLGDETITREIDIGCEKRPLDCDGDGDG